MPFCIIWEQGAELRARTREGEVFDILVVRVRREFSVFGFQFSVGTGESRPRGFEKEVISAGSFGESKSTEKRVMNQDLRRGPWVEHALP